MAPVFAWGSLVLGRLDSGGWHTGSVGGEGRPCLAFSVEDRGLKSELTAGGRDATGVKDTLLGVGPFDVVAPFGVVDPALLALLRTFGVEGVRGVMRGWGVEGALALPDFGV